MCDTCANAHSNIRKAQRQVLSFQGKDDQSFFSGLHHLKAKMLDQEKMCMKCIENQMNLRRAAIKLKLISAKSDDASIAKHLTITEAIKRKVKAIDECLDDKSLLKCENAGNV